jgi:hypothetical protein
VSYFLDQSNALADGTNYLQVTLTESGSGVDFLVQTLDPLNSIAGSNFGIDKFGFNFTSDPLYEITGLPDGWRATANKQMSEFGRYDIRLQGRGNSRTDELHFTVGGTNLSDFDNFFAAHVGGFEWCQDDDGEESNRWSKKTSWSLRAQTTTEWFDGDKHGRKHWPRPGHGGSSCGGDRDCITSAYFGGGSPVPLPAAMWLFGSGLLGLIGVARRKKQGQGR